MIDYKTFNVFFLCKNHRTTNPYVIMNRYQTKVKNIKIYLPFKFKENSMMLVLTTLNGYYSSTQEEYVWSIILLYSQKEQRCSLNSTAVYTLECKGSYVCK